MMYSYRKSELSRGKLPGVAKNRGGGEQLFGTVTRSRSEEPFEQTRAPAKDPSGFWPRKIFQIVVSRSFER